MADWLGKTIGKVRIDKLLARGGMAEVYLGTHLTLDRPVAIKVMHSYIEEEPNLLERFHREAKVVAGLRHTNIVQIFDFDTIDGHPYLVMEYLKGPTLATYLRYLHQRKKRLPYDQIAHLMDGLAVAIDYAHRQGVIHRDIKPANILLHSKTGEIPLDQPLPDDVEAIVTDFGLVRVVDATTHTSSGTISGTPSYMSPEQAIGAQIDYRTDLYSLGVMLYEMLAGHVPFTADNSVTILHMQVHTMPPAIPGIPAQMQAVVDRALRKNREERYQTGREMADEFYRSIGRSTQTEPVLEPPPVSTEPFDSPAVAKLATSLPETPLESAPTKPSSNRVWMGVGLFSLVIVLLLGAWGLFSRHIPFSRATQTLGQVIVDTATRPLPSAMPSSTKPSVFPTSTTSIFPTPTLGIDSTMISNKDGMTLLYVPAGKFTMGNNNGNPDEKPAHQVTLDAFWIDQTEVTNEQYAKCVQNGPCAAPVTTKSATRDVYYGSPQFASYPVINMSWDKANTYCSWAGRQLPTEAEWEKAARDTDERTYPWGIGLATKNLLNSNGTVGDTTKVGSYPDGKGPYGALDMAGNVWEWVADWYDPNYYTTLGNNATNPKGPPSGRYHVLRGGSWFSNNDFARSSSRGGNFPAYGLDTIGFRCAMSAGQ